MIKKVDHIAIAVKNLEETIQLYDKLFGIRPNKIEALPQQGVKAAILPIGEGAEIELIEPMDPKGGVAQFIESRGEGIHHICFEVDNIDDELVQLANKGFKLVDEQGRPGIAGKVGFLHPGSTKGVLIELAQKQ